MPHVLDRLPFRPGGLQRQRRLGAIQSLDRRLLVDAENCCVLGGMQVQTQDVFGLGFKVGVRAGHVPPQSIRLRPGLVPDAHDRDVAQAQFVPYESDLVAVDLEQVITALYDCTGLTDVAVRRASAPCR
jgi:hypothetical protein